MRKTCSKLTAVLLAAAIVFSLGAETAAADESPFLPPVLQWDETIILEGMPETFRATLFRWDGSFSLWYDAQSFALAVTSNSVRFDLIENMLSGPVSFSIKGTGDPDGYNEPALSDTKDEYEQMGWVCEELNTDGIMPNFHLKEEPVQGFIARKDGQTAQVYISSVAGGSYLCTVRYPQEAAEGWGARMMHMLNTLEYLPRE